MKVKNRARCLLQFYFRLVAILYLSFRNSELDSVGSVDSVARSAISFSVEWKAQS